MVYTAYQGWAEVLNCFLNSSLSSHTTAVFFVYEDSLQFTTYSLTFLISSVHKTYFPCDLHVSYGLNGEMARSKS